MDRFDELCEAKALARTNDPQTSKDAAERMVEIGLLNKQEGMVYEAILRCGKSDFTTKDIAKWISWSQRYNMSYDKAYEICRRRFSGLEDKGKIEVVYEWLDKLRIKDFKRRDGCRVWRLKNG